MKLKLNAKHKIILMVDAFSFDKMYFCLNFLDGKLFIKYIQTIIVIFNVIITTLQLLCSLAFFKESVNPGNLQSISHWAFYLSKGYLDSSKFPEVYPYRQTVEPGQKEKQPNTVMMTTT